MVVPVIGYVFVAVDDTDEDEISVPLDSFDEEGWQWLIKKYT